MSSDITLRTVDGREVAEFDRVLSKSKTLHPKADEVLVYTTGNTKRVDTDITRQATRGMNNTSDVKIVKKKDLIEVDPNRTSLGEYMIK